MTTIDEIIQKVLLDLSKATSSIDEHETALTKLIDEAGTELISLAEAKDFESNFGDDDDD